MIKPENVLPDEATTSAPVTGSVTADELIRELEARGLGWSLDHTGRLIEARVWAWPNVVGRYRPRVVEPLADMLAKAMLSVNWARHPVKSPNSAKG